MSRNQEYKMTITKDKLLDIYKEEYLKGDSTLVLSDRYKVNPRYFSRWFNKLGLEMRSNKINSRKYELNHDYFEDINTNEKAYWLGFLYADGYVSKNNGKRVGLTLGIKDINHLKSFSKCIDSTYPIKTYISETNQYKVNTEYARVLVASDKMYDDLVKNGVVEHKTDILEPPKIKYDLIRYFILGYFDGDGSIFLNNAKHPFYSINIVGTDDICDFIGRYLLDNNLIKRYPKIEKRKENQTVSYIRFGGNILVSRILTHLYEDMNIDIVLKRKHELFIKCKNKQF